MGGLFGAGWLEEDIPIYLSFPKPSIKYPTIGKSHSKKKPNKPLLPKAFAKSSAIIIPIIMFIIGNIKSKSHQPGRPTIFSKTYIL